MTLTLIEFTEADVTKAKAIAERLGFGSSCAYVSSGALPGLQLLLTRDNPDEATIIKTKEAGFLLVRTGEDLGLGVDFEDVPITLEALS